MTDAGADRSGEHVYDLFQRGQQLISGSHWAQAVVPLEKARRLEPDKTSIREALGRAYFRSGRYREAAGEFEAIVELNPTSDYAHFCLGRSYQKLGRTRAASRHFSLACGLRPDRSDYRIYRERTAPRSASTWLKALVQRVDSASVTIDGDRVAAIGAGLLILVGIGEADTQKQAARLADKCARLRIFDDEQGRMGRSLVDLEEGAALCVSQFTLYGDTRKGTRPSFTAAAAPELAEQLYEHFCGALAALGPAVERGRFGARMSVELINNGPVTLLLEI